MKNLLYVIMLLVSGFLQPTVANQQDPKPLELELGKTTLEDFKIKYSNHEEIGFSTYTKGLAFKVQPVLIPLDNVKDARFFFNSKNKLALIFLEFPAQQFNTLKKNLSQKYSVVKEEGTVVPVLGNIGEHITEFKQGNVEIILSMKDKREKCTLEYFMTRDPDNLTLTSEQKKNLL